MSARRRRFASLAALGALAVTSFVGCGPEAPATPPPRAPATTPSTVSPAKPAPVADFRAKPPAPGPEVTFVPPKIEEARLANGARVLVVERHELPIVAVQIAIDRGADQAPPGVGSFAGGMLMQGTKTRNAIQISDEMQKLGATMSAWVDFDASQVSAHVLAPKLADAMTLVADVTLNPAFSKAEVERFRSRRLTALGQIYDSPQSLLSKHMLATVYPEGHPYATLLVGTEEAATKVTPADLAKFHATHFRPDRATIAFAGDITKAQAVAEAERAFGKWKGKAPDAAHAPAPPAPSSGDPRVVLIDRPGATQSIVSVALPGVPRRSPDFDALVVMNSMLGGQFSSRLNMNLREKHAYTYGASSNFDFRHGPGPFSAGGAMVRESTGPAVKEILGEVARIRSELVTEEELEDTKSRLIRQLPSRFESAGETAATLAGIGVYGLPLDEYATRPARFRKVTREDVKRVAEKYLTPDRLRVVVVGDAAVVREQLGSVGLGEVNVKPQRPASAEGPASATPPAATPPPKAKGAKGAAH